MAVYGDLVRYRDLFANLFRRDFQAKYRGSALGVLWSLVNPLALVVVYLVVFGVIWNKTKGIPHYPLYLLSGIACWIFFAVSLQTAARSMVDSADLIRKVRFPRQLVAFSVVATQAVTFAVMLGILIVLSLIFIPDARRDRLARDPARAALRRPRRRRRARRRVHQRRPPRRRAHPRRGAPAVVLPHARSCGASPRSTRASRPHHKLIEVLRWGNPIAPPIAALRDALWSGHAPTAGDTIYLAVAAVVALVLGLGRLPPDRRPARDRIVTPR